MKILQWLCILYLLVPQLGCRNPLIPPTPYVEIPKPTLINAKEIAVDGFDNYYGHKVPFTCAIDDVGLHCWGELMVDSYATRQAWLDAQITELTMAATNPVSIEIYGAMLCVIESAGTFCQTTAGMINELLNKPLQTHEKTWLTQLNNPHTIKLNYHVICGLSTDSIDCIQRPGSSEELTTVPVFNQPVALDIGSFTACGLDIQGVQCWRTSTVLSHVALADIPTDVFNPTQVVVVGNGGCVLHDIGVDCWGGFYMENFPALSGPYQITAGEGHVCALDTEGAKCWGMNLQGFIYSRPVVPPPQLINPTKIAAQLQSTCAIDDSGIVCWHADFAY
jgi:hypothetical protein